MSQTEHVKLKFDHPVVILGGGNLNVEVLRGLLERSFPIIAADGAADEALELGLPIEAIIGDFDSIADPGIFDESVAQIELTEQETTDFEKCLYSVEAPLYICFGMTGKRFDHTLAALHTVTRYCVQKQVVLIDEDDISLGVNGDFEMALPDKSVVSIYPLVPTHFQRSDGLMYPLDGLRLEAGTRIGTSNKMDGDRVSILTHEPAQARYLVTLPIARAFILIQHLVERKES